MATKTTIGARARRLPDGSLPRMAGGDDDGLMASVRDLNTQITSERKAAGEAWAEFEKQRGELSASGASATDPTSDVFQKAEAASRAYSESADRVAELENKRDRLLSITTAGAPRGGGNGPEDGRGGLTIARTMLPDVAAAAGNLALQSADYQRLVASNAFTQVGRKSIEAVLVNGAGEQAREHLKKALMAGGPLVPQAALVTGANDSSAGSLVVPQYLPGITVPLRNRPLRMLDLITVGQTDSDTVHYVRMTGFTNNAAETAEATTTAGTSGTKPESALSLDSVEAMVKTIAHWIPATKRALADAGQLRTLIENILGLGLDLRLDQQIVDGNGQGENIRGIRNTPGIAQVQQVKPTTANTLTPEAILDTIHRAITTVRLAFFEPTAIGIHPIDFEKVRLARSFKTAVANTGGAAGSPAEGEYLMGDPSSAGATTIWGLTPVVSAAFSQGFPVIGDYRQAVLWLREGTQILASDSHMDFFIRNLVAILAEFRAAFGVLAPAAFCEADIS